MILNFNAWNVWELLKELSFFYKAHHPRIVSGFLFMLIGKISSVINGKAHKIGGGLYIRFKSDENLIIGNLLKMHYNGKEYTFEVFEVETYNSELVVQAKENGYWAASLRNDKKIDLRNLVGIDVFIVTNPEDIERINNESNWC